MRAALSCKGTSCAPANGDPVKSCRVSSINCTSTCSDCSACSACSYAYCVASAGIHLASITEQCACATTTTFILKEAVSRRRHIFEYTSCSCSSCCTSSSSGNNEQVNSDISASGNHKVVDAHVGEYVQHEARANEGGAGHVHCNTTSQHDFKAVKITLEIHDMTNAKFTSAARLNCLAA